VAYERIASREALDAMVDLLRDEILPPLNADDTATYGVYPARAPGDVAADSLGPHPYAVVHCDPGAAQHRLTGTEGSRTLTWYVKCVGGTLPRALSAADRVMAATDGASVSLADGQSARLTIPPGYTAGVPRQDPPGSPGSPDPPRYTVPLQFQGTFAGKSTGS
jgi:hypothetical protein